MGKLNISKLIAVFLMAVVGLALTPTIQELVLAPTSGTYNATDGTGAGNLSGASSDIFVLFPLFWTILMIAIPVAYVAITLKGA